MTTSIEKSTCSHGNTVICCDGFEHVVHCLDCGSTSCEVCPEAGTFLEGPKEAADANGDPTRRMP